MSAKATGPRGPAELPALRARVAELERTLASILDHSADAIVSVDQEQRIIAFNRGAEVIFGYSVAEVMGRSIDLLIPGEHEAAHRRHIESFLHAAGSARTMGERREICGRRKSGEVFPAQATISKLAVGEETVLTSILRDVTEHHQLEEQLRQVQKMDALGRLAGGIAHDFNNLLTGILGFAELLQRRLAKRNPLQRLINEILECGRRAASLTRQLLYFSRPQVGQPEVLAVNAVVTRMEKMLRRLISEDIELAVTSSPDAGNVLMDPGQLEQVLLNLVVNARDAMPRGGRLGIQTRNEDVDDDRGGSRTSWQRGRYAVLQVTDDGCGMDQNTQRHMFDPFFTTKGPGKGTGLGLSTVFGIVRHVGGHIEVDSAPGQGTSFTVYVPTTTRPLAFTAGDAGGAGWRGEVVEGSETILLVDDEEVVCRLAAQTLNLGGYNVLAAHNSGEALLISERHRGPIHLLLTDIVMPLMNGWELAERLRQDRPAIKVLYMTGYLDDVLAPMTPAARSSLLHKPFTPECLRRSVREALAAGEC